MMLHAKRLEDEMFCADVVIYEQGEYRHPLVVIPEFDAAALTYHLFKCLSENSKKEIFEAIKEKMEKNTTSDQQTALAYPAWAFILSKI